MSKGGRCAGSSISGGHAGRPPGSFRGPACPQAGVSLPGRSDHVPLLSLSLATATLHAKSDARPATGVAASSIAPVVASGTLALAGESVNLTGALTDGTLQMSDEAGFIAAMAYSVGVPVLAYCGALTTASETDAGSFDGGDEFSAVE